jgi:hypothetical protein
MSKREGASMSGVTNLSLVQPIDQEIFGIAGECAPLLPISIANAVCLSVNLVRYQPYQRTKLVFKFSLIEPEAHVGTTLEMFVRTEPSWKEKLPPASKLHKIACIANGARLKRGQKVVPSMFLNRVFKCRLRKVGDGAAAYTIIDTILEKLTG